MRTKIEVVVDVKPRPDGSIEVKKRDLHFNDEGRLDSFSPYYGEIIRLDSQDTPAAQGAKQGFRQLVEGG